MEDRYKKVNIYAETKVKLDKVVKKSGMLQAQWLDDAIEYFLQTGVNPRKEFLDTGKSFAHIERLIKARCDTIIGFIKEQEKSYLLPIATKQNELIEIVADASMEVVDGQNEVNISPVISENISTKQDEELFKLKQENYKISRMLIDLRDSIDVSKTTLGGVRYELKISEAFYNELKTMNID